MERNSVDIENNIPFVLIKGKRHTDAFITSYKVNVCKNITNYNSFINCIYVSKELFETIGSVAILFNSDAKEYQEVFCHTDEKLQNSDIRATSTLLSNLKYENDDELFLLQYNHVLFNDIKVQKIDNIKEDYIVISKKTIEKTFPSFNESKYRLFSLYNTVTGENIVVKKKHIIVDDTLKEGTIRLSRVLRIFLGLENNDFISDLAWKTLDQNSEEYKKIIETYDSDTHEIKKNVSYIERNEISKVLKTALNVKLELYPVIESINKNVRRNAWQVITDFYVGKSTLSLPCKRPYDIDEGKDVIRLSKNNMSLLGISNMDKVRVTYRNKVIKCRVLELEDKESFKATNVGTSCDLMVGIPINLRKRLGIYNISSVVKIDRDTPFLFKKSISEQVLPILITIVSSLVISNASALWTAIISLIAAPIVVYLNLSSKRSSRLK